MVDHPDKYDYSRAKVDACPLPSPTGEPQSKALLSHLCIAPAQWEMLPALRCQGP